MYLRFVCLLFFVDEQDHSHVPVPLSDTRSLGNVSVEFNARFVFIVVEQGHSHVPVPLLSDTRSLGTVSVEYNLMSRLPSGWFRLPFTVPEFLSWLGL